MRQLAALLYEILLRNIVHRKQSKKKKSKQQVLPYISLKEKDALLNLHQFEISLYV